MKHKHKAQRADYSDMDIVSALDANCFDVSKAADMLGVPRATLRNWIRKSEPLQKYLEREQHALADEITDTFMEIMRRARNTEDPRTVGNAITAGKAILDKILPSKQDVKTTNDTNLTVSPEAEQKLKELLGE